MKLKIFNIEECFQGENSTYSELISLDLGAVRNIRISKYCSKLYDENKLYNDERMKLCDKYGELTEDKLRYEFKDKDKQKKFEEEYNELLNSDTDIEKLQIVIKDTDNFNLSVEKILKLSSVVDFIVEDGEVKT